MARYLVVGIGLALVLLIAVAFFVLAESERFTTPWVVTFIGSGYTLLLWTIAADHILHRWPKLRRALLLCATLVWYYSAIVTLCLFGASVWLGVAGLVMYVAFGLHFSREIYGSLSHHDLHVMHHIVTHRNR